MIYTVRFYGVLAMVLGVQSGAPISLELPEESKYGSVLDAIQKKYGNRFPPSLWDGEKKIFFLPECSPSATRGVFCRALVPPLCRNAERFAFTSPYPEVSQSGGQCALQPL